MKYDPSIHHRRSIRLKGYDYSQVGAYFVTICTKNRECLFGAIVDGEMILNEFGKIVHNEWLKTANIRSNIIVDEFIVMPNHLHGILIIVDDDRRGVLQYAPTEQIDDDLKNRMGASQHAPTNPTIQITKTECDNQNQKLKPPSNTIGTIVRGFKSTTTKQINQMRQKFDGSLWQRNYYEHSIRNENELNKIRQYIINNPLKWSLDFENPVKKTDYKNIQEYFERII